MRYQAPFGSVDPDASYVDKNVPGAVAGSKVPAAAIEHVQRELVALILKSGITPDADVLTQVTQVIRSQRLNYVVAGGAADALTATLDPPLAGYTAGLILRVLTGANPNTGAMTFNVNRLGAVAVKRRGGSAMQAGDAPAGSILNLICRADGTFYCLDAVPSDYSIYGRTQVFAASGAFTVPSPTVEVEVIGGGGAGGASGTGGGGGVAGNAGGGGGGGGYAYKRISGLAVGSSVTVTVGAGGTANAGAAGGSGGTSSFGAHASGAGGSGGGWGENTLATGGNGGAGTGGDLNVTGGAGGFGGPNVPLGNNATQSDVQRIYNKGGMAAGGLSTPTFGGTGQDGRGYGTGGGGASGGSGLAGGAGAAGLVIVRW